MREVNECAAEIEPVDCLRIKTWGSCAGPGWRARIDGALPDQDFAAGRRFVRFGRAVGFSRSVFRGRCLEVGVWKPVFGGLCFFWALCFLDRARAWATKGLHKLFTALEKLRPQTLIYNLIQCMSYGVAFGTWQGQSVPALPASPTLAQLLPTPANETGPPTRNKAPHVPAQLQISDHPRPNSETKTALLLPRPALERTMHAANPSKPSKPFDAPAPESSNEPSPFRRFTGAREALPPPLSKGRRFEPRHPNAPHLPPTPIPPMPESNARHCTRLSSDP